MLPELVRVPTDARRLIGRQKVAQQDEGGWRHRRVTRKQLSKIILENSSNIFVRQTNGRTEIQRQTDGLRERERQRVSERHRGEREEAERQKSNQTDTTRNNL